MNSKLNRIELKSLNLWAFIISDFQIATTIITIQFYFRLVNWASC